MDGDRSHDEPASLAVLLDAMDREAGVVARIAGLLDPERLPADSGEVEVHALVAIQQADVGSAHHRMAAAHLD